MHIYRLTLLIALRVSISQNKFSHARMRMPCENNMIMGYQNFAPKLGIAVAVGRDKRYTDFQTTIFIGLLIVSDHLCHKFCVGIQNTCSAVAVP